MCKLLLSFGMLSLVVGCGRGYQGLSGNCSQEFVSDYNNVQSRASRSLAVQFKEKYRGTVCTAKITRADQLDPREVTVDSDKEMAALISEIDAQEKRKNARS